MKKKKELENKKKYPYHQCKDMIVNIDGVGLFGTYQNVSLSFILKPNDKLKSIGYWALGKKI